MSTPRTAAVVGAGLAGTTAALGLVDAGFAVTLYSDRDRDALRNDVPATGTAVYFGKSREADARIIEDLYADGPHSTGMSTRLHTGEGDTRADVLEFDPDFRYVAQGVDVRLRADDRLGRFLDRGGRFEVRAVNLDDLDAIAADHDLTLVATGKGGLSTLFPVDTERTVYSEPQRRLLLVTLQGLGHGPDTFGYRSDAGGAHNLFNLHTDFGEAWLGPYLHKDAGATWSFPRLRETGQPVGGAVRRGHRRALRAADRRRLLPRLLPARRPRDRAVAGHRVRPALVADRGGHPDGAPRGRNDHERPRGRGDR